MQTRVKHDILLHAGENDSIPYITKFFFSKPPYRNNDETEFVNLIDTLCYVLANEGDLDFQNFCRIWRTKGVLVKFFLLMNAGKTSQLSANYLMSFITECTR